MGNLSGFINGGTVPSSASVTKNTVAGLEDNATNVLFESLISKINATGGNAGWRDNIQSFSAARGNGTTEPIWRDMGNGQFAFQFTPGDELFVQFHINHDYALGTNGYPHIHFLCLDAQSAGTTVDWRFAYTIAKGHMQGESLTVTETIIDMTYTFTGSEVAGEHIVLECSDGQAFDLIEPDALVMARVELLSETASGRIFCLMSDIHYRANYFSTKNKAPNFYA